MFLKQIAIKQIKEINLRNIFMLCPPVRKKKLYENISVYHMDR